MKSSTIHRIIIILPFNKYLKPVSDKPPYRSGRRNEGGISIEDGIGSHGDRCNNITGQQTQQGGRRKSIGRPLLVDAGCLPPAHCEINSITSCHQCSSGSTGISLCPAPWNNHSFFLAAIESYSFLPCRTGMTSSSPASMTAIFPSYR